jgi:hypothetical protein
MLDTPGQQLGASGKDRQRRSYVVNGAGDHLKVIIGMKVIGGGHEVFLPCVTDPTGPGWQERKDYAG